MSRQRSADHRPEVIYSNSNNNNNNMLNRVGLGAGEETGVDGNSDFRRLYFQTKIQAPI